MEHEGRQDRWTPFCPVLSCRPASFDQSGKLALKGQSTGLPVLRVGKAEFPEIAINLLPAKLKTPPRPAALDLHPQD